MIGISGLGIYIPSYRLTRESLSSAWGENAGKGERAVGNHDEDSLTMAVEAVLDCLRSDAPRGVDGLFYASTTAPYAEKQNASLIAAVADLPRETFTVDCAGSLRAGTSAFRLALNAVTSGSNQAVIITAADCRMAEPGSRMEGELGDGAAAALVSSERVALAVEEMVAVCHEFTDLWRKHDDSFILSEDDRFVQTQGYVTITREAVEALLRNAGCQRQDIRKVVFCAPDARAHRPMRAALGFDQTRHPGDSVIAAVGNTGVASPFLALLCALEDVQAGDRLIFVGYGGGAEAYLLQATEYIDLLRPSFFSFKAALANQWLPISYGKYLKARQVIPHEKTSPFSAYPILWREQDYDLSLYGQRCTRCDAIQYPVRRVCWQCGAKDEFERSKLSREGRVYTFCRDYVYPSLNPPVMMAAIDLKGGGRFFTQLTDCSPDQVKVGLEVELTFRRFHEGGGFYNYYWKAKPTS